MILYCEEELKFVELGVSLGVTVKWQRRLSGIKQKIVALSMGGFSI